MNAVYKEADFRECESNIVAADWIKRGPFSKRREKITSAIQQSEECMASQLGKFTATRWMNSLERWMPIIYVKTVPESLTMHA